MGENDEIKTVDAIVTPEQSTPKIFDENGKFAKGHVGHQVFPRQPSKRQQYLAAFQRGISHDDMENLAKTMVTLALQGDTQAAKLVCDYNLGKPVQAIEVETSGPAIAGVLQINLINPNI